MKIYQLSNLNELRNIYVYQSIYAKFLVLAMSLILLLLSNFWKKLNANGNFSSFRWRHRQDMLTWFFDFVDSRFRTQDVQLIFARIIKYFVPFLEASHSILLLHWVNQSLPLILLNPIQSIEPFRFRFFQTDPYIRWIFW